MNLQHLRYLVEIADCRSITKAAKKLYVSQPYLSKVVSNFEQRFGKKLFLRCNPGLELTEHGHKVYLLAQSILRQIEEMEHLGDEVPSQGHHAKLAFSVGNLLLNDSLLSDYLANTHAARSDVDVQETTIQGCIKNIQEDVSEFAILVVQDVQKPLLTQVLARKGIAALELDEGCLYYHFHGSHAPALQDEIPPACLPRVPFVRLPADEYADVSPGAQTAAHPQIDMEAHRYIVVNNYQSYLNLVKHNAAFMLGNKWQVSALERHGIQSIPVSSSDRKVSLMMLKKEFIPLSQEAKAFVRLFQAQYGLENG